eukprot:5628066-Prymnesium_polylepis.1
MANGVAQRSKAGWRAVSSRVFMSGAPTTRAILVLSYSDGVLPLTAPNLLSSFAVERCGAAG